MATVSASQTITDELGIEPTRMALRPLLALDCEEFMQLAVQNPDLPLELNTAGEVLIMSPTGGITGWQNGEIFLQLAAWNKQHQRGIVFDSSTLFGLPQGSVRSPDASCVEKSRWVRLPLKQKKSVVPLCPDFLVELRSETDRIKTLKQKMDEYIANGVELAWLVDPLLRQVHLYEQGKPARTLDQPDMVRGTGCVEGFELDLREIFAELK